ncbi:hypothetical protein V1264_010642 [Littorina saxatilis]|uniref:Hexosyltransferase n=2 Tax=Littorina saxatilis TaxID=31220 RepID=A0AAN9G0J7_9CAEN
MTRLDFILDNLQDFPPDEYLSKEASFFTPRPTLVHRSFPRVLMNCSRCPETGPVLLVIVPSVVQHVKHREAIRSTWASPVYGQLWPRSGTNLTDLVKLVFFFGVGGNADILRQECKHYGDIVQADFTENYRNLSLKMAAALQWSVAHCAGAGHVMKVDEDTFVNLPLAYDLVKTLSSHRSNYILGFKHHIDKPPVVRKGKWNVEKDLYPFPKFPRYLTGPSYLMSGNAAKALASTSKRMPLIPNEDAYVTGILAKAAGVQRIHSPSFAHEKLQYRPCELVDGRSVSQTRFKPYSKLYDIWRMLTKGRCDKH